MLDLYQKLNRKNMKTLAVKEPKYVPFTFMDDLLGLKIKYKDTKEKAQITRQEDEYLALGPLIISYDSMLKYCVFLDNTPCGKLDKNEHSN